MGWPYSGRAALCAVVASLLACLPARPADTWKLWAGFESGFPLDGIYSKLALAGTNIFFSSIHSGVFRASMEERQFRPMPTNGLPELLSASSSSVFDLWHLAVTPQGTLLAGLNPARQNANTNVAPLIYRFDETTQQWVASLVHGRLYPYTAHLSNLAVGPDGTIWAGTGWTPYVYRSTNDGVDFTALDLNARVPTNYFPIPGNGVTTFGKLYGVLVTPSNEVIVGTETGGYLHSYDLGETWTSLAADFTDTNSVNPLGRAGNAAFGGLDRRGNVLCVTPKFFSFPGQPGWVGCQIVAYRPSDGSYWKAGQGILAGGGSPFRVETTAAGVSFTSTTRETNGTGGIYRSGDGLNWQLFNDGIPYMNTTGLPGLISGDSLAVTGTVVLAVYDNVIWSYDTLPPPVTNRAPTAFSQGLSTITNVAITVTLSANDPEGTPLTYTVVQTPLHGTLTGLPPLLMYAPSNRYVGEDEFRFVASDGATTSAVAAIEVAINTSTGGLPAVAITAPPDHSWLAAPTAVVLAATATDVVGIARVRFFDGTNVIATVSNAPYTVVWTNPSPGRHLLVAKTVNATGARNDSKPVDVEVLRATPRLQIRNANTNVVLSWPLDLDGFLLEARADLNGAWSLVPQPPLDEFHSDHAVTIPGESAKFFRLWHP